MKKTLRLLTLSIFVCVAFASILRPVAAAPNAVGLSQESNPNYGVITSTPNADGSIIHIVKEGESCWTIAMAYGLTCSEIQVNSGNSAQAEEVYVGTTLVIRRPFTPTPTNNHTPTPTRITPMATVNRPTFTPMPSFSPFPTATATPPLPLTQHVFGNSQKVGLGMAALSLVGLVLLVIFGFLKKEK